MWLKRASSQGGEECWGGRSVTGKKASFVDDRALLFYRDEWLGDFTHPVFPPLLKFLNINTDSKRNKEEKKIIQKSMKITAEKKKPWK